MAQKIAYWLLIALIISLGFGQLLRFDLFSLPIYLHDILVVLILVTLFPAAKRTLLDRRPEQSSSRDTGGGRRVLKGTTAIYLFLAGLALSWLYAYTLYPLADLLVPSLYTLRLLAYLALYFTINKTAIPIPKSSFLISGLVTLVIGLAQYVLLPDMRIFQYLGWDDHLSRLTLPHFDPTFTGVMLGLFLLSAVRFTSIFDILVLLFSSLGILLTYSRSVWLSLILTFGYFMLKNRRFNYLIIGVCLLVIPILFLPKKFGEGTNLLRTYSITSRFESDLAYIQKYKWDLLIGRGMNTLILDSQPSLYDNHATGPNNSYLYLLATTGVLGLVGWGSFMYLLYHRSSHQPMLIFFFVASLFNNVMFYPFALLWVLLVETQNQKV